MELPPWLNALMVGWSYHRAHVDTHGCNDVMGLCTLGCGACLCLPTAEARGGLKFVVLLSPPLFARITACPTCPL